mgnify:CR=1 FL=1
MELPKEFKACVEFHGHSCPGLAYGYIVVKEAMRLLDLKRSHDEEVVAICENDSCAVDAFQVLLGTTIGKGNLIIKDYGKNAYTILDRSSKRMYRFSRTHFYNYTGKNKEEFQLLERALSAGKASSEQKRRQKLLKTKDLIKKPFDEVFSTRAKRLDIIPILKSISIDRGNLTVAVSSSIGSVSGISVIASVLIVIFKPPMIIPTFRLYSDL